MRLLVPVPVLAGIGSCPGELMVFVVGWTHWVKRTRADIGGACGCHGRHGGHEAIQMVDTRHRKCYSLGSATPQLLCTPYLPKQPFSLILSVQMCPVYPMCNPICSKLRQSSLHQASRTLCSLSVELYFLALRKQPFRTLIFPCVSHFSFLFRCDMYIL